MMALPTGMHIRSSPVLSKARRFVETLIRAIDRHRVIDLAAQLAYWALLAVFPFVIFLLTVVGYLPLDDVDRQLMGWAAPFMPDAALRLVWETVHEVLGKRRGGLLTISLLGALWSASGGASALAVAINRAYGVEETRPYWRRKGLAILTTIGATGLLIVAVAGATLGPNLIHAVLDFTGVGGSYSGFVVFWSWVRWPASIAALIVLLAAAYNVLPNVRHGFGLVSLGSLVAVAIWFAVSWGFRIFVGLVGSYARTYGALGAVVMLLTWIYLSGIAVIIGAEVNATLAHFRGEARDGDPAT